MESGCKSVLVSYLGRNKVFKIPKSESNEVLFLAKVFKTECNFQSNVRLKITFERFDKEWDDFVEVEKDCSLEHKEKLKAVVTSTLATATSTEVSEEISVGISDAVPGLAIDGDPGLAIDGDPGLDGDRGLDQDSETDEDSEIDGGGHPEPDAVEGTNVSPGPNNSSVEVNPPSQQDLFSDELMSPHEESRSDETSSIFTPSRKRPKSEDDDVPLPTPFPLPKHYRADIEAGLRSGEMTKDTTCAFLSAVASAMLVYKRHPSREDYVNVGRTVIEKYTFLKEPIGTTPYVEVIRESFQMERTE